MSSALARSILVEEVRPDRVGNNRGPMRGVSSQQIDSGGRGVGYQPRRSPLKHLPDERHGPAGGVHLAANVGKHLPQVPYDRDRRTQAATAPARLTAVLRYTTSGWTRSISRTNERAFRVSRSTSLANCSVPLRRSQFPWGTTYVRHAPAVRYSSSIGPSNPNATWTSQPASR